MCEIVELSVGYLCTDFQSVVIFFLPSKSELTNSLIDEVREALTK